MPANKSLLVLPGDGIGPEVMRETKRVIDWMAKKRAVRFEVEEGLVGGCAIDAHGVPVIFVHPKNMGGVLVELMLKPSAQAGH